MYYGSFSSCFTATFVLFFLTSWPGLNHWGNINIGVFKNMIKIRRFLTMDNESMIVFFFFSPLFWVLSFQIQCFAINNSLKLGVIFRYFCFRMTKSQTVLRFWLKRCFCSSAEPIRLCFQQRLVVISSVVTLVILWETVNFLLQMYFWAVDRGVFT